MLRILSVRCSTIFVLGLVFALGFAIGAADEGRALILANDETRSSDLIPPDFPYWDSVVQRRYEAPSAIYLGAGWAITARHVGYGELIIRDQIYKPDRNSRHTLLNLDGSAADGMVFKLDENGALPDLPILPIADRPPEIGDEILMIGFGRVRESQIVGGDSENPFAIFAWSDKGEKRWGTNRIEATGNWLYQQRWVTRTLVMTYSPPDDPTATPHEASPADGDSGGAVFAKMDGEWKLVGLIISVASVPGKPMHATAYGDAGFAADLSLYRDEIFHWARPQCANEVDDDGDGSIDYPTEPDCRSPEDDRERAESGFKGLLGRKDAVWLGLALMLTILLAWRMRRQRGRNTPDSTRPSSAA